MTRGAAPRRYFVVKATLTTPFKVRNSHIPKCLRSHNVQHPLTFRHHLDPRRPPGCRDLSQSVVRAVILGAPVGGNHDRRITSILPRLRLAILSEHFRSQLDSTYYLADGTFQIYVLLFHTVNSQLGETVKGVVGKGPCGHCLLCPLARRHLAFQLLICVGCEGHIKRQAIKF